MKRTKKGGQMVRNSQFLPICQAKYKFGHILNRIFKLVLNIFRYPYPWAIYSVRSKGLKMESGMGMCRGHDPFFQAIPAVNAPLLWLPFSSFRKFLHFQPCFCQNSSSLDPNFSKFSFPEDAPFFKENPLPRPYILKPAWHTSTKKKVECPPRVGPVTRGQFF